MHSPALTKVANSYEMSQLKELTDPSVLYRLPLGFLVIDYFNPPNNCFSVDVGKQHLIDLRHVEKPLIIRIALSDAMRDGESISAVVRGREGMQDGKSESNGWEGTNKLV